MLARIDTAARILPAHHSMCPRRIRLIVFLPLWLGLGYMLYMRICVITCCCEVVVGPGAQLCTLPEVWVLGVGMSTLGAQTVRTPRVGGPKYRLAWSMGVSL